ncbi:MAG: acyltransferase [Gemella haemolysans]|jgi:putative acetyl transferase|uniref:acyltransferase family protein n=1 Tax=Gemella haemolysans TaxID=1379 RepID=UPI002909D090|nr:acyltransferase [Gemella haemolysans]MDU4713375.1 acyltransferase [Gemella haemolysans]
MTKNRINWIDFGKGFTIFLVLLGHVFLGLYESGKFINYSEKLMVVITQIYIFHIPVFFALSGFFFKSVENIKEFKNYILKRTIVLGLPYIFYSIIHFALQKIAGESIKRPTTIDNLINIYKSPIGITWYLYILWIISIFYGFLSIYIKRKDILFIISIIGFTITLFIEIDSFIIQRMLIWGMFFMLGAVLSKVNMENIDIKLVIPVVVIFDIIYMISWRKYYRLEGKLINISYDNPQLWVIGFIVSVIVAFIIFPRVEKLSPTLFDYFSKYGRDSLGIYILHSPICSMLRIVMLKIGISSIYLHIIIGIILGWFLSIIATNILKKIPYLNIVLLPQRYVKLR